MNDRASPLQRLIRLLRGVESNGVRPGPSPTDPDAGDEPECDEVPSVTCEEAVSRVYEFLDGELDERDMRSIRCHLEQCRRCYPMYDWERLFLDAVSEHGSRPASSQHLRSRLAELLERPGPA